MLDPLDLGRLLVEVLAKRKHSRKSEFWASKTEQPNNATNTGMGGVPLPPPITHPWRQPMPRVCELEDGSRSTLPADITARAYEYAWELVRDGGGEAGTAGRSLPRARRMKR